MRHPHGNPHDHRSGRGEPSGDELDSMLAKAVELHDRRSEAHDFLLNRLEGGWDLEDALASVVNRYGRAIADELGARLAETILKASGRRRVA